MQFRPIQVVATFADIHKHVHVSHFTVFPQCVCVCVYVYVCVCVGVFLCVCVCGRGGGGGGGELLNMQGAEEQAVQVATEKRPTSPGFRFAAHSHKTF